VDIREKYKEYRSKAQDGDIILWSGTHLLARIIKACDDHYINDEGQDISDPAYYTHTSIMYWGKGKRLHNIDSWAKGITVVPASHRLKLYKDFCVLRPLMDHVLSRSTQIDHGLNWALEQWDAGVKYDYLTLPRIAIVKKTGIDLTGLGKRSKHICSEFTRQYSLKLGIEDYHRREHFTPQDHIRFNEGSFTVLFDEKILKKN